MARFGDNPIKNPLTGGELIPATDPDTGSDICLTPDILAAYMATSLPLATATGNGLMSSVDYALLHSLYTAPEVDAFNAIFKQEALGFFIGTVADGYIEFMANPIIDLTIIGARFKCASGTVNATLQINGVSVTGLTTIAVSSVEAVSSATANNIFLNASRLGLLFAGNASCLGFYISILAYRAIP